MIALILLVLAFACFALAAKPVTSPYNLVALGLACWVASLLAARVWP